MLGRLLLNPYALGALALLIVGMLATIFYYRAEALDAEADAVRYLNERNTAIAINEQKDKEIARLVRQAEINNEIMVDLHKEMQEINEHANELAAKQAELEGSDPEIKELLDRPYPDALRRLLN